MIRPFLYKRGLMSINTFDIDGVISIGVYPGPNDVIITGRSFEESVETYAMLRARGINNPVFFNSKPFDKKTRESSGYHKANVIWNLIENGTDVKIHFEDDEVQVEAIRSELGDRITVVHLVHNLTDKENVRYAVE